MMKKLLLLITCITISTIQAMDKSTIKISKEEWEKTKRIIEELDKPRPQVVITTFNPIDLYHFASFAEFCRICKPALKYQKKI